MNTSRSTYPKAAWLYRWPSIGFPVLSSSRDVALVNIKQEYAQAKLLSSKGTQLNEEVQRWLHVWQNYKKWLRRTEKAKTCPKWRSLYPSPYPSRAMGPKYSPSNSKMHIPTNWAISDLCAFQKYGENSSYPLEYTLETIRVSFTHIYIFIP